MLFQLFWFEAEIKQQVESFIWSNLDGFCSAGGPQYSVYDGAAGGEGQHLLQRTTEWGH